MITGWLLIGMIPAVMIGYKAAKQQQTLGRDHREDDWIQIGKYGMLAMVLGPFGFLVIRRANQYLDSIRLGR